MDNDQNTCSQGSGPGSLLCQARVAQGLSREDVAQRLHLAARQIVALENDDYANLPGPTYVRGYLRGYANLLGLKPERILAAYATLSGSSQKHSLTSLAPKEEITSQDNQVKFATYVVAAIVLGLAVTWWQGREVEPAAPHETVALPTAVEPNVEGTTDFALPMEQTDTGGVPAVGSEALLVTPSVIPTPLRVDSTPATPVPTPLRTTPRPTPIALAPTPAVASVPPVAPAAAISTATPEIRANLVLYADEESWVDVRDALQNKLIYETVPAGRRVVLEGAVPLKIFIGNAPGVRVEFNGKPYDITSHKRGLIARFTLGQELMPTSDNTTGR